MLSYSLRDFVGMSTLAKGLHNGKYLDESSYRLFIDPSARNFPMQFIVRSALLGHWPRSLV